MLMQFLIVYFIFLSLLKLTQFSPVLCKKGYSGLRCDDSGSVKTQNVVVSWIQIMFQLSSELENIESAKNF